MRANAYGISRGKKGKNNEGIEGRQNVKGMNQSEAPIFCLLLEVIPNHRRGNAKQFKLVVILTIGLLRIIGNGDTFTGMEFL